MQGQTLFDFTAHDIDGKLVNFADYKGKKKAFMIVNVASACGYTDVNYKGLQEIYNAHKDQGLEIFAFPCNQFAAEETKCEADIKTFASSTYQVTFPMFSKIVVNGPNTHALYKWMKACTNTDDVSWNFNKFIIDRNGTVKAHKSSSNTPASLVPELAALLG